MKIFIITLALAALALAEEDFSNLRGRVDQHRANRAEWVEKFKAMTEEERQEKIRNIREHVKVMPQEMRDQMRQKFEKLSVEERRTMFKNIHHKLADGAQAYMVPVPAEMNVLSEEDKQKLREKFPTMTPEEREEARRQLSDRVRGPRPADHGDFQKIRNRFDDIMVNEDFGREMHANKRKLQ